MSIGRQPIILWLEWKHYYADNALDQPQIVLRNHQVFDMNRVAARRGVAVGMRKHQYRGLVENYTTIEWEPDPNRAKQWLDRCVPFSGCIEPVQDHCTAIDFSSHPSPIDLIRKLCDELYQLDFGDLRVGLGPSKWIAKIAADLDSPLELMRTPESFLAPLPLDYLSPVDQQDRQRLQFLGYKTISQVALLPFEILKSNFSDHAYTISQAAKGELSDPVSALYPVGVLQENHHFVDPINDDEVADRVLIRIADALSKRLTGQQAAQIVIEAQEEKGKYHSFERRLKWPVKDFAGVFSVLRALKSQIKLPSELIRLSVRLEQLEPSQSRQASLYRIERSDDMMRGVKALRRVYGDGAILKASEVPLPRRIRVLKEWRRATGWY